MSQHEAIDDRRRALFASAGVGFLLGSTAESEAAAPVFQATSSTDMSAVRLDKAMALRMDAARRARSVAPAIQRKNDDEIRFPRGEASFSKGLPHDENGLADAAALNALRKAVTSGKPRDFDVIPVANVRMPLVNPQGGLSFAAAGLDACQFSMPPAPTFDSASRASEAIELYWMSVLRDVPFAEYPDHPLAKAACQELSSAEGYAGPKSVGGLTPDLLFRGTSAGELMGPHLSQFLIQPVHIGALTTSHQISTYLPVSSGGHDYLTDFDNWLAVQNGEMIMDTIRRDPVPRYMRSARDLAAYVHTDYTYQAFFNASCWLAQHGARPNGGSPYQPSVNQIGFATYGVPDAQGMLAFAHLCALRAVWFQKWMVHRTQRPEEFGGRVHLALTRRAGDPLHPSLRASRGVAESFARTGGYLLPQAYPEGSPLHPSYAQGHAACAGACATVLKVFFDGSTRMLELDELYEPTPDGRALKPHRGPHAGLMTMSSELDKLAGNIAMGRNMAGIHWRSDALQGLLLGEAVALALLRDMRSNYPETLRPSTFESFSGALVSL